MLEVGTRVLTLVWKVFYLCLTPQPPNFILLYSYLDTIDRRHRVEISAVSFVPGGYGEDNHKFLSE